MQNNSLRQAYRLANETAGISSAVVVFTDDNSIACSRWLTQGFRHCFVAIASDTTWMIIDALSNRVNIWSIPLCPAEDLSAWYRHLGYKTVITRQRVPPEKSAPWAFFTCVEAIKRLLGIHRHNIQTPHQLWNFLKNDNSP